MNWNHYPSYIAIYSFFSFCFISAGIENQCKIFLKTFLEYRYRYIVNLIDRLLIFRRLFNISNVSFQVGGWKLHSKSKILIAVYFVASCTMPIYIFFTYSPEPRSVGIICTRTPGTQGMFDAFNISIKRTFSTIVLGFIIFVLSFLMANELYKQRRTRKQMTMAAEAGGNGGAREGRGWRKVNLIRKNK